MLGARAPEDPAPASPAGRHPVRHLIGRPAHVLECVVNVSEGRDAGLLSTLASACGDLLLDLHADRDHHRSVFTLAGAPADVEGAARALASAAVQLLSLGGHEGAHPRFGVVDVVPFVALGPSGAPGPPPAGAAGARDAFAAWAGAELGVPCFCYGPLADGSVRTLPEVRRHAFADLAPDTGPPVPHPLAGATAVGARGVLLAWNLWLAGGDGPLARRVAAGLRSPEVRVLGFDLPSGVQVSCNLVDPLRVGPGAVYDRVEELLSEGGPGTRIARCELVGLAPAAVVEATPSARWAQLDLSPERTVEERLAASSRS